MFYVLFIILIVLMVSIFILALINASNRNTIVQSKSLFGSSNCASFNPPSCTYGDNNTTFTMSCYNTTNVNCYSGRQLSEPMKLNNNNSYNGGYIKYKVVSIIDANGFSCTGDDLNISLYQDCSPGPDLQLCGESSENGQISQNLQIGQLIWVCAISEYYIGVNSGDNANIATPQFYVCLGFEDVAENEGAYMQGVNLLGCSYQNCSQKISK